MGIGALSPPANPETRALNISEHENFTRGPWLSCCVIAFIRRLICLYFSSESPVFETLPSVLGKLEQSPTLC